jgi:hypothetical protein
VRPSLLPFLPSTAPTSRGFGACKRLLALASILHMNPEVRLDSPSMCQGTTEIEGRAGLGEVAERLAG